jgi:hypothetical protein
MTEHNCRGKVSAPDAVALAAYTMDSHNCQRIVKHGRAENEGDVQVPPMKPYPIVSRDHYRANARTCWCRSVCRHHCLRLDPNGAVFMISANPPPRLILASRTTSPCGNTRLQTRCGRPADLE